MDKASEGKTSFTSGTTDKVTDIVRYTTDPEPRTDEQNEALAHHLMEKLGASDWTPYLAVGYSGLPHSVLDRHLATALEKGREPAKLFMHLVTKEPLWKAYKLKHEARRVENG